MLSMSFWTTWARLRVQLCVLTRALSSWPLSSLRTCSAWAGLTLTSEKPDNRSDVTSSWARTWGAQGLISTSFSEIWIGDERMTLDSLHGSAAQNGGGANTAPAWYGGAPRSRQMPSPSHPADLGVWKGKGGKWEAMGDKRRHLFMHAGATSFFIYASFSLVLHLCTVAKFSCSSCVMLYSGSALRGSLMQSSSRPPCDCATLRSSWKFKPF